MKYCEFQEDCLIIVQARLNSKRFPRKVFASKHGKTVLEIIHDELEILEIPILFAIPEHDIELYDFLQEKKYCVSGGSENNVRKRFIDILKFYNKKYCIRICADSPLIDSIDVLENITKFRKESMKRMIWGQGSWVFSTDSLIQSSKRTFRNSHLEHVITDLCNTIDYPEDLIKLNFSNEFI